MELEQRFSPTPEGARAARHFVQAVLDDLDPDICHVVMLLTSELATNGAPRPHRLRGHGGTRGGRAADRGDRRQHAPAPALHGPGRRHHGPGAGPGRRHGQCLGRRPSRPGQDRVVRAAPAQSSSVSTLVTPLTSRAWRTWERGERRHSPLPSGLSALHARTRTLSPWESMKVTPERSTITSP